MIASEGGVTSHRAIRAYERVRFSVLTLGFPPARLAACASCSAASSTVRACCSSRACAALSAGAVSDAAPTAPGTSEPEYDT